jgi:hypothetical protein
LKPQPGTARQTRAFILLLSLTLGASSCTDGLHAAQPDNYCHDPEANQRWGELLLDAPADDVLLRLFALRLGLCQMVDAGILTLERATEIFERARQRGLLERREQMERWQGRVAS